MNKMLNISLMALAFASASLNVSAQTDAATPAQQKADVDLDAKYATNLLEVGSPAPDLAIPSLGGGSVTLADYKGKYVVVDFWASWCPDCRRETPALQRLWQKYGEKGLQIAGISYDTNREAWQKYIADNKMEWWQYSELKKWKKETQSDRLYHINWIPTLYLIAPDGRVALATVMMDKVEAELAKALGD